MIGAWRLLTLAIYLIRELIFDNKEEYNLKSSKFNTRKVSIFLLIIFLVVTEAFSIYKLYVVSKKNVELNNTISVLKSDIKPVCKN